MINLGTDKIKDIYMGVDGISKVYLGTSLIWEKNTIQTISWIHPSQISPFTTSIIVYDENANRELRGRYIIDITIGDYKSIEIGNKFNSVGNLSIYLGKSVDELLGVTDFIPANTKITVRYKEE